MKTRLRSIHASFFSLKILSTSHLVLVAYLVLILTAKLASATPVFKVPSISIETVHHDQLSSNSNSDNANADADGNTDTNSDLALETQLHQSPYLSTVSKSKAIDQLTSIDLLSTSPHEIQPTTSIIDILSSSAEFSIILSHIQRLGLVPLLNQARNITFLAPSNDAFLDIESELVTEHQILYHILNTTFLTSELEHSEETGISSSILPSYLHTKNYRQFDIHGKKLVSDKDTTNIPVFINKRPNPDRDSKEKFVFSVGSKPLSKAVIVESDLKASKNRGVVHVVNKLLEIPKSACSMLRDNPETQIFYEIFSLENNCSEPVFFGPNTLFVPSDEVFSSQLDKIELDYLLSEWGKKDRKALLKRHTMSFGFVASPLIPFLSDKKSQQSNTSAVLQSADGSYWNISTSLTINETFTPFLANNIANDGIVHFYDFFLAGKDGDIHSLISFTPEKCMLVLGAEPFVKEIKFRGLEHLINGSSSDVKQTIFSPLEDSDSSLVSSKAFSSSSDSIESQNIEYKALSADRVYTDSIPSTLYHFVEGQYHLDLKKIVNSNYLLTSKAKFKRLGYGNQRIMVTAEEDTGNLYLNAHDRIIAGPYDIGNTTIYLIDGSLDAPPAIDLAIGSVLQASRSAKYLSDLGLLHLPSTNGWTVLLPTTIAWKRQGLVTTYLQRNMTALRHVLESHILRAPFYSDSDTTKTLLYDNTPVTVSRYPHAKRSSGLASTNSEKLVSTSNFRASNGLTYYPFTIYVNDLEYHVESANILSNAGVIHSINSINIPDSVEVTVENLLDSVDATLFVDLLVQSNMSYVLDRNSEYTILAPSNQVLLANNITIDTPNIETLLRLHILPNNPIDKLFRGEDALSLQENIHLVAREIDSDTYVVSIVESYSHHDIRVLQSGDTTKHAGSGKFSTVLYVDNFFSPDWIMRPSPPFTPPFHLRTSFAILLGVVFGAILIFVLISVTLLFFLGNQKNRKHSIAAAGAGGPGSANGSETSPDRQPLLSRKSSAMSSHSAGGSRRPRHSRSGTHSLNSSPPELQKYNNNTDGNGSLSGMGYGATDSGPIMLPDNPDVVVSSNNSGPSSRHHSRRGSVKSVASMTSEHSVSEPIPTIKVHNNREHGKHLNLPRMLG